MAQGSMRGVYVILVTPFDEYGALDEVSLRRQIRFCLDAGVHGVVGPAVASEYWTLSDDERREVTRIIVDEVAGAVPTVIGVSAGSASGSVALARYAEAIGASAVMATPPTGGIPAPESAIYAYYQALSDALTIPIFVQNIDAPFGTRLSPAFMARLIDDLEQVRYVKEETLPPGRAITALRAVAGPRLQGIMGGIAGRYLLDEYRRGAIGTMPACQVADVHVQVWEALEAGEADRARSLFTQLLPMLNFEGLYGIAVCKEVLRRRGVIQSAYLRTHAGNPLDDADHAELDAILADLSPLFRVAAD